MKTIIVPTEFTTVSQNAVQFAVDMALHIHATILLLHVYQVPVMVNEISVTTLTPDETRKTSDERLAEIKEEIEKQVSFKINVITESRPGNISDELSIVCNKIQPFAVVMGNCQSGKLERILFGSAALSAMHHLETPVLLIPPDARFKPVQKIGLAYDFRHPVSEPAQKEIRSIVKEFNAELHILNVDHNVNGKPENRENTFLLHRIITDLNPQYHFIDRENIAEGLNKLAEQNNIDFMVIIPRKHKLLEALFHKNHSDQMALNTHIPLMAIHA